MYTLTNKNNLQFIYRKINNIDAYDLWKIQSYDIDNHHNYRIVSEENQQRWIQKVNEDDKTLFLRVWSYINSTNKNFDGFFYINDIDYVNRTCNVGYDLLSEYRGKGLGHLLLQFGEEICKNLNLRRIQLEVLENNIASQRVAEKNDFKLEGVKKESVYKNGTYINSYFYAKLI